jgi:uncharacterized membrane protein
MHTAIWIVQGLVALAFGAAGLNKVLQPREKLIPMLPYVEDFTARQVKAIGSLETLGALGMILPALTRILPWLTPLAGVGLALVMVGAAATHWRRNEQHLIPINLVLLALALFVAYGRFIAQPIE